MKDPQRDRQALFAEWRSSNKHASTGFKKFITVYSTGSAESEREVLLSISKSLQLHKGLYSIRNCNLTHVCRDMISVFQHLQEALTTEEHKKFEPLRVQQTIMEIRTKWNHSYSVVFCFPSAPQPCNELGAICRSNGSTCDGGAEHDSTLTSTSATRAASSQLHEVRLGWRARGSGENEIILPPPSQQNVWELTVPDHSAGTQASPQNQVQTPQHA